MFPNVNYIGNKRKLSDWITNKVPDDVDTITDAFAGGGSVSYEFKEKNYDVVSNDALFSSFVICKALIENKDVLLQPDAFEKMEGYKSTSGKNLEWMKNDLYFDYEITELEKIVNFAEDCLDGYEYYMFLALLRRAMIRKLPYSRMNVNWDNIVKLRDEEYSYKKYGRKRAYHNQTFEFHMMDSLNDYNLAVFDSGKNIKTENLDVLELLKKYPKRDLLYLDPPYPGTMNNYDSFYGKFDEIFGTPEFHIDLTSKKDFLDNMRNIFRLASSYKYVMISYNNSINPSEEEFLRVMNEFGKVTVYSQKHNYQLSGQKTKNKNIERLAIIKMGKKDEE
ncbi:DNA methyltransferase [Apilactobacillus kunkeei]|uniref:DNA adenine methylase n=1 Tax=Apilactobacillus kunkeei TaxID=148814 RepID=UPI00112AA399|nr:DNA adenine methylase [Apilactobacillus kunkeei]TPR51137.1 DNA methyltransferase [Apilactobacillus kunkeei]WJV43523.1 DNA adenine methylase [Apilactobacillus kunkeei]